MDIINSEKSRAQMRKGILEFAVLLTIAQGKVYASEMLDKLKAADLIVVEGTLYPLLSRLKQEGLLTYSWAESPAGPPRKYYELTAKGRATLVQLTGAWKSLAASVASLIKQYEKNS